MASNIDPTVFPDNAPVDKANLRQQFQVAKDEITALQGSDAAIVRTLSIPRRDFFDDSAWNSV